MNCFLCLTEANWMPKARQLLERGKQALEFVISWRPRDRWTTPFPVLFQKISLIFENMLLVFQFFSFNFRNKHFILEDCQINLRRILKIQLDNFNYRFRHLYFRECHINLIQVKTSSESVKYVSEIFWWIEEILRIGHFNSRCHHFNFSFSFYISSCVISI